jgi:hypothetical protein
MTSDERDQVCDEYFTRAEAAIVHGRDGWARLYAAIACAAVDALEGA